MDKNQLKYQFKLENKEVNGVEFQKKIESTAAEKELTKCIESEFKKIKFDRNEKCKHKSYTYFNDMYEITIL